ncbi:hypothetical protein Lalb_Chr16g0385981 [Lupinus albus]|uniref:Uncharacterized protein n=1 Tax=Lupinus albus TaxID=3870 RepID=A0A6A4NUS7_LUPAL|nr:hypothetical protein Lalb_Chr16g0385981 [Lupinus albus]
MSFQNLRYDLCPKDLRNPSFTHPSLIPSLGWLRIPNCLRQEEPFLKHSSFSRYESFFITRFFC